VLGIFVSGDNEVLLFVDCLEEEIGKIVAKEPHTLTYIHVVVMRLVVKNTLAAHHLCCNQ